MTTVSDIADHMSLPVIQARNLREMIAEGDRRAAQRDRDGRLLTAPNLRAVPPAPAPEPVVEAPKPVAASKPFRPEPFTLYGVDRIIATASPYGTAITIACLDHEGRDVELHLHCVAGSGPYLNDAACALNGAALAHGRLTHEEERVLRKDGSLPGRLPEAAE